MNRRGKQISIFNLWGGGVTTRFRVILLRRVRFENHVLLSKKNICEYTVTPSSSPTPRNSASGTLLLLSVCFILYFVMRVAFPL